MQGLAAEAERLIAEHRRGPLLDVVVVASAQAIGYREIAAYRTMHRLARSSGMAPSPTFWSRRCRKRRPPTRS
jgi:ferritin-like metal-binding protein YciE